MCDPQVPSWATRRSSRCQLHCGARRKDWHRWAHRQWQIFSNCLLVQACRAIRRVHLPRWIQPAGAGTVRCSWQDCCNSSGRKFVSRKKSLFAWVRLSWLAMRIPHRFIWRILTFQFFAYFVPRLSHPFAQFFVNLASMCYYVACMHEAVFYRNLVQGCLGFFLCQGLFNFTQSCRYIALFSDILMIVFWLGLVQRLFLVLIEARHTPQTTAQYEKVIKVGSNQQKVHSKLQLCTCTQIAVKSILILECIWLFAI